MGHNLNGAMMLVFTVLKFSRVRSTHFSQCMYTALVLYKYSNMSSG